MPDGVLMALLVGLLAGSLLTLAVVLARRATQGSRDLGTDAEHATHRTLHLASRAAAHLRSGLGADEAQRAVRPLRELLGSRALALVDVDGAVVVDGASPPDASELRRAGAQAAESDRVVVVDLASAPGRERRRAVAAPLRRGGRAAGALVAVTASRPAPMARAVGEAAEWVSAQLSLAELDASRAALAEAELRELRAQISPHFIYNALNAIAASITTDPAGARELVLEFADFTRYSFRRHGDFTTLAEELRSIHSYLRLERARFGDRLDVTLQIAPETLSAVIPFLSLQPLVENAVRHGLESREHGGHIAITAEEAGTHVQITIDDDGVGADADELAQRLAAQADGEHVGLRNVDTRLRRIYGDDHGLEVATGPSAGMLVRMRVPRSQPHHGTEA